MALQKLEGLGLFNTWGLCDRMSKSLHAREHRFWENMTTSQDLVSYMLYVENHLLAPHCKSLAKILVRLKRRLAYLGRGESKKEILLCQYFLEKANSIYGQGQNFHDLLLFVKLPGQAIP